MNNHQTSLTASQPVSTEKIQTRGRLRWGLGLFFFVIGLIAYMDRANISIVAEHMMRDLGMTKVEFGLLGALFSLGYALAQIPSGMLAERFGCRLIVTLSLLLWSLFTILTATTPRFIWLCIVRFLFGVGEAPTYPGNAVFNSWWFRKNEKARAASLLLAGSYFGPVIAPTITVLIMLAWGWHAVFFIFGAAGIAVALLWFFLARDRPDVHPWISSAELKHIREGRAISQKEAKAKAPWRQFMRNREFWAVGIQYFFVVYMTTLFMIWLPTYLQEARGFSLTHMGIAASFPWLAICLCVLFGGKLSDSLLQRGRSLMAARGYLAIGGFILFIVGTLGVAMTINPFISVFWLTLTLGALGLPVVVSWAVAADKGQQYSGSVSGWMNLWGNLGGVISPVLCGFLAQHFGWNIALLFNILPIALAIVCWFFINPDRPLNPSQPA
ncbi:MFS transporter [Cedecea neteri]|uniref:MFS transporter n=1 Tax=Cedecea neteri TaxID=158822 RepID=UPI0005D8E1AD|nr:MFS transporter [Cedecea neteri]AJZ91098.1 glucarate transporter [Klebsiella michiganensis]WPU23793.1 MFS transporter [Cedecea neteri]